MAEDLVPEGHSLRLCIATGRSLRKLRPVPGSTIDVYLQLCTDFGLVWSGEWPEEILSSAIVSADPPFLICPDTSVQLLRVERTYSHTRKLTLVLDFPTTLKSFRLLIGARVLEDGNVFVDSRLVFALTTPALIPQHVALSVTDEWLLQLRPVRVGITGRDWQLLQIAEGTQGSATGGTVWDVALVTAEMVAANVKAKRVLDLGAGTGLAGLCCAASGASEVVLSDVNSACLRLMQSNQLLNSVIIADCAVTVVGLDWDHAPDPPTSAVYDIIVASECVYSEKNLVGLFWCIARHLAPADGVGYVSWRRGRVCEDDSHVTHLLTQLFYWQQQVTHTKFGNDVVIITVQCKPHLSLELLMEVKCRYCQYLIQSFQKSRQMTDTGST